jgi:uracil-DNA glycosylase
LQGDSRKTRRSSANRFETPVTRPFCNRRDGADSAHNRADGQGAQSGYAGFQRSFVESVVSGDQSYYEKIASLLGGLAGFPDASHITLLDLCRASFVLRVGPPGPRNDDSQGAAESCWPIFQKYVETTKPREWLWRRISETPARRILALGSIAEHGLLRLFDCHNTKIHRRHVESTKPWRSKFGPDDPWAKNYAEIKKITWWLDHSDWWEVDTKEDAPRWRVLPISHPSARKTDYTRLGQVLSEMIQ